jgi:hypothetical protein
MLFIDKLPLQHLISWTFVPDKTGIRFRPDIRRNNPGHIPVPVHHPCLRQTNTKSKRKGSLFINHLHSPDLLDAGAAKKYRNQFSDISDNVASIFSEPFLFGDTDNETVIRRSEWANLNQLWPARFWYQSI